MPLTVAIEASSAVGASVNKDVALTVAIEAGSEVGAAVSKAVALTAAIEAGLTVNADLTWESAPPELIKSGLGEAADLIDRSELPVLAEGEARATIKEISDFLASQARVPGRPEKSKVIGPLQQLRDLVLTFSQSAAKSAGDLAGKAAVVAALAYVPPLHQLLNALIALASR